MKVDRGLEQLNRRDNQSLIQTAMQNMQARAPSQNVLSGILDFKLHLINLQRGEEEEFDGARRTERGTCGHPKHSTFGGEKTKTTNKINTNKMQFAAFRLARCK